MSDTTAKNTVTSRRAELLAALEESGAVTFYDKRAVGRWYDTLSELESEGKITQRMLDIDSQSSCLEVRLAKRKRP